MSELNFDLHVLTKLLPDCIKDGMDSTINIGENIAQYCEGDESLKARTRDAMRKYIAMEAEINQHVQAVNDFKSVRSSQRDQSSDWVKEFKARLREMGDAGVTVQDHPRYLELEEQLASTHNIDEQLESLRHSLLGSTQEEDVMMTETEVNIKCPYTGQPMTDPMRNTLCGHVYEKEGILGHIRAKKGKAKCPVGGCANAEVLKPAHLEEHKDMKRYITLLTQRKR